MPSIPQFPLSHPSTWPWTLLLILANGMLAAAPLRADESESPVTIDFNREIRPILSEYCFACHGPGDQESGLRLDVRDVAIETGAIVPGEVEESELLRRILSDDEAEVMPPPEANKSLDDRQRQVLRDWIAQGAHYEQHWSFLTPRKPEVPEVESRSVEPTVDDSPAPGAKVGPSLPINPIDAFVGARLQSEGLEFSPPADRETLIRRVAFTLTGLPPTLEEIDAFLQDTDPLAYERMVDRYLASKHYGEEMARHWLDVARYADTHGLHLDNERQMWAYRDWVIKAFNRNLPFDQFTIEQLAGDLLPDPTPDQLVATGFNRCNVTTSEGGSINEEWVFRYAVDRTATMAEVWMGLTAGCAVCHDHKYDPLSAQEFYSLYAFFHSAADPAMDGNALLTAPTLKLTTDEQRQALEEFDRRLESQRAALDQLAAEVSYEDPAQQDPRPQPEQFEETWFEDQFPEPSEVKASPGEPTRFVSLGEGPVFRGERAVQRTDAGLAQDVYEGKTPLVIPPGGRLFAHVWLDPDNPPRSIMLQYFKEGWRHRAVWGDEDAIAWGEKGTTERAHLGELPTSGRWVRLEFPVERVGLAPGDAITGFALTQFGGTVTWDSVGVTGRHDPAGDPRHSFLAWWSQHEGKDVADVPRRIADLLKQGPDGESSEEQRKQLREYYVQHVCETTKPAFAPLIAELESIQKQREDFDKSIPSTFIFKELESPRESFVMLRGEYNQPGEKVEPGTPAILPPLTLGEEEDDRRATRLDLAQWLVSPEHPLTSRVAVNRWWQQVFGQGLVKTSFDFGSQGEVPSHPELLDWLSVTFREDGWDVKGLMRLLVTSATFRQSSAGSPESWQRDPENRLYSRGPRFRLDAEQIRDNVLAVSGLLVPEMGGPGVKPYQPPNIWEPVAFVGSNTGRYQRDDGAALYRRSIYSFLKRTAPPPFMANFDAPNREASCAVRERSNTPLQALQLMNDTQHFEAARALAARLLREGGDSAEERLRTAYRLVLSRSPSEEEREILGTTLQQYLDRFAQDLESAQKVNQVGEWPAPEELPAADLAAYTLLVNLIFNLDETVTRN